MLVFSAKQFRHHADRTVRRVLPESHLEALDGKPVAMMDGKFGKIIYSAEGENWYLYPVPREWCEERRKANGTVWP